MSWSVVALGDVARTFNGKTPSVAQKRACGHPVLKIRDIDEFGNFRGFDSFIDHDLANRYKEKATQSGDTLILNAAHSATHVGSKICRVPEEAVGAMATGEWLVVRSTDRSDAIYLNRWLRSKAALKQLRDAVKGIHLYPKDVALFTLPLPPLDDQRRIAGILDAADALRRRRREALALLDTLPGAIFAEMFGDIKNGVHDWEVVSFTEACSDRTSRSPKVKASDYAEQGTLPVVDQGAALMAGFIDDLDLENVSPLPVVVFGDHTRIVKHVDFRFATGADGAKVLEPGEGFDSYYLAQCIRSLPLPELGYSRT